MFFISLSITSIISLALVLSVAAAYFFLQIGTRANRAQEMEEAIFNVGRDRQHIMTSSASSVVTHQLPGAGGQSAGV